MSEILKRAGARVEAGLRGAKGLPHRIAAGTPLENARREEFARLCVEGRLIRAAAYRLAYNIPNDNETHPSSYVWQAANDLYNDVQVSRRMRALKDEAARQTIISVAQLLQDYVDIANADPAELIRMQIDCCRHCHGEAFAYEYNSETEYVQACEAALKMQIAMPPCGGTAFRPDRDPNPACPHCYGRGISTPVVGDTRKLSPPARKLYKGLKITKQGIEVLMHDQHAARESIGRILGAFKADGSGFTVPPEPVDDKAASDPQAAYMRLVKG